MNPNLYAGPDGLTGPAGVSGIAADGAARDFGRERGGTRAHPRSGLLPRTNKVPGPKAQPFLGSPLQIYVSHLHGPPVPMCSDFVTNWRSAGKMSHEHCHA